MKQLLFDFNNVLAFGSHEDAQAVSQKVQTLKLAPVVGPTFFLNQELLEYINQLKNPAAILSASVFLLKNEQILKHIQPYFDQIFLSKDLSISKDLPASYLQIAALLKCQPADIIFVDDQLLNVSAAQQAGCTGLVFRTNQELLLKLTSALQA